MSAEAFAEWAGEQGLTVAFEGAGAHGRIDGIRVILAPQAELVRPDGQVLRTTCGFRLPVPVTGGLSIEPRTAWNRLRAWGRPSPLAIGKELSRAYIRASPGREKEVLACLAAPSVWEPLRALLEDRRLSVHLQNDLLHLSFGGDPRLVGAVGYAPALQLARALSDR